MQGSLVDTVLKVECSSFHLTALFLYFICINIGSVFSVHASLNINGPLCYYLYLYFISVESFLLFG